MRFVAFLVLGCVLAASALGLTPAAAQSPSPAASATPAPSPTTVYDFAKNRVDTMLRTSHADADWFAPNFLAQIPIAKFNDLLATFTPQLGAFRDSEITPAKIVAHFEHGDLDVTIHLNGDDKIDGILFKPATPKPVSLDDALRMLQPASGTVSYIVQEGRSDRAALNASASMAVGSAFKLAVLNALQDEIAKGHRRWTDIVALNPQWKTLPSGVIRTWPDNLPMTIATYATQMISISDNTAADALVHIDGPRALAPYAGANLPFMTTREMVTLKSTEGAALRARYLAATTPAARASILRQSDALPLPAIETLVTDPLIAIEWHYSVRDLCKMMRRVAKLPLMSVNPGGADASAFRHVAFKGGSDFGIMNLTTMVTTRRGTTFCVSATVNDATKAVDEAMFGEGYAAVLRSLEDH